jgi:aspartate carbamoyltransferase catalytic subunit
MRHLLDVDELAWADIERILARAARLRDDGKRLRPGNLAAGRRVALLFAEASTRTRLSFEVAARNLGAETFVVEPGSSSMVKGETLVDTVRNLDALGFDALVLRHHRAGAPWVAARYFGGSVVNAGDGWHAHPTQALLDLFTLRRALGDLSGKKVAIVGDLLHSRVARSNAWLLAGDGAELWVCGPQPWLRGWGGPQVNEATDLVAALEGADAVMGLRVQRERMRGSALPVDEYVTRYQITEERLAAHAPRAVYLHPGPINEGIEVTREVARGPRSLVLEQVCNGVPVRMAVLETLLGGETVGEPAEPVAADPAELQATRDLSSARR